MESWRERMPLDLGICGKGWPITTPLLSIGQASLPAIGNACVPTGLT